jgi:hypothetical protein
VSLPSVGDVLAAIFASGHQAEPGELIIGPSDQVEAGAALGAGGSPEVELEISL